MVAITIALLSIFYCFLGTPSFPIVHQSLLYNPHLYELALVGFVVRFDVIKDGRTSLLPLAVATKQGHPCHPTHYFERQVCERSQTGKLRIGDGNKDAATEVTAGPAGCERIHTQASLIEASAN